ncbi:hypothetical protein O181_042259 [Austropuccinia psidii MF-1]|uniref:Reverse transcriptase Ty1/copia-type domain-containing protein n=1 Tax=Austropuccinia psidii MF-1 TaxID=1389203 RepID=A0A9Q3DG26_9BASI|nr:hypothetical protein [Austropuccinia psidii MF-1]
MNKLGFECSEVDASLSIYQKHATIIIVWIDVDDGIVIGNSIESMNNFKQELMHEVDVQWQTNVEKIVGLHIKDNGKQLEINQKLLIDQYLCNYSRPIVPQYTRMTNVPLVTNRAEGLDTTNSQSAIGTLMYISGGSRPEITYSVHMLARFSSCPNKSHWLALNNLSGYLLHHQDQCLRYLAVGADISLWVDVSWGGVSL